METVLLQKGEPSPSERLGLKSRVPSTEHMTQEEIARTLLSFQGKSKTTTTDEDLKKIKWQVSKESIQEYNLG